MCCQKCREFTVTGPNRPSENRTRTDTKPSCRSIECHHYGERERDSGQFVFTDDTEVYRLDQLGQGHGEKSHDHETRQAHHMAGNIPFGESGICRASGLRCQATGRRAQP